MFIVKELCLNSFANVSVPRPKDLYCRVGGRVPALGTTGFKSDIGKSKLELLAESEQALLDEMNALENSR